MSTVDIEQKLKIWDRVAYVLSAITLALVVLMRQEKKPDFGIDFSFLPSVYSAMNAVTALLLILALVMVKKGNIRAHKNLMLSAIGTSILFLLMYVLYHFTTPETKYCGVGNIRYFYFFLLITHIILAGVILPFILLTFNRGFLNVLDKHRKMAKYVYPLWLYVALTGPVIYYMLSPCYQH